MNASWPLTFSNQNFHPCLYFQLHVSVCHFRMKCVSVICSSETVVTNLIRWRGVKELTDIRSCYCHKEECKDMKSTRLCYLTEVCESYNLCTSCPTFLWDGFVYRNECVEDWCTHITGLSIPCSPTFSFQKVLGSDIKIHDWNIAGLPRDSFSIENAIIVGTSRRYLFCSQ